MTQEFDLSAVANAMDIGRSCVRRWDIGFGCLFLLFVAAGIYILAIGVKDQSSSQISGGVVVSLFGALASAYFFRRASRQVGAPRVLKLEDESLSLIGPSERVITVRWTHPGFRVAIRDLRGLDPALFRGQSPRFQFTIRVGSHPIFPLTLDAAEAVLLVARRRGLRMSELNERIDNARAESGFIKVTTLLAPAVH